VGAVKTAAIQISVDATSGADRHQIAQALHDAAWRVLSGEANTDLPVRVEVPATERQPLAPRQKVVWDAIVGFCRENGHVPPLREIANIVGFKSTQGASDHLESIARKGWIRYLPSSPGKTYRTYRVL
jgi:repressor LexA